MDFVTHSIAWCRGEIFEGRMFGLFGLVVLMVAVAYWKMAATPSARAMFVPLLVVGIFALGTGIYLNLANQARIPNYEEAAQADERAFAESEKERTEAFIKWYPVTMWSMSAFILAGCLVFLLIPTPRGRAIGLSMAMFGLSVLFLDHFSEVRAEIYHAHILDYLAR
jgi:ABC-type transport system involved in cytochrome bd biosynthesis fused ATPase/permease subunit